MADVPTGLTAAVPAAAAVMVLTVLIARVFAPPPPGVAPMP